MHHIALDRPRAHNRDLNDQIIKLARAQTRQHVHLRAAFDLKDAKRIPLTQHRVGFRVFARHRGERQRAIMVILQHIKTLLDTGQHPQSQHIDLEDAQRLNVVLIPFDKAAIRHRAVANRHRLSKRPVGQNEPAHMLREVARHTDHLFGEFEHALQMRVGHIKPGFARVFLADLSAPPSPHGARKAAGHILR